MKLGPFRLSSASLALLVVQLAIVSSIAGKYLYQRQTCPRVWTRAAAYDPEMLMRGRYLSTQVRVDGCGSTLPSAKSAQFPHNVDGTVRSPRYRVQGPGILAFRARLAVADNRLIAIRLPDSAPPDEGQAIGAWDGSTCDDFHLTQPVSFYLPEHAANPLPLQPGQELWMEVTVPPKGPPRPTQLAIKQAGKWQPVRQ